MTRAMDSVQAERAGRSHIAPIPLVKLTLYSDRPAGTVAKTFYFSNMAVDYDYGNTGTDQRFLPVIIGGSDFFSGFVHIPQPDDLTAFNQKFYLQCSNKEINGSRLIELLQTYNLEGASIEIAQMLVDSIPSLPVDLTSYTGDEHTVLFRGCVNRISPISDAMLTIQCVTELPSMAGSWIYASDDTKTDPLDLGKRLPRIYGNAKRVPLVNYEVGWVTSLGEVITSSTTGTVEITDGSGLPPGSFDVMIDGERITCSAVTATTMDLDTRSVGSPPAAAHDAGAVISELLSTATYIVSDRQCNALNELYVINPLNGILLRLNSTDTPWTTTLNDTGTISGETITIVKFTAAQLQTLIDYFKTQAAKGTPAAVDDQPDFSIDDPSTVLIDMIARESRTLGTTGDAMTNPTGLGGVRRLDGNATGSYTHIVGWYPVSSIPGGSRVISRWRTRLEGNARNTHTFIADDIYIEGRWKNFNGAPLNGTADEDIFVKANENADTYGLVAVGSWHTPSASTTLSDFESAGYSAGQYIILFALVYLTEDFNTDEWVEWAFAGVEVELEPSTLTRDVDVAVSGGGGNPPTGYGLRFFADVDGFVVPELEVLSWQAGHSMDGGSWSVDSCAVAVDTGEKYEGTGSQEITIDVDTESSTPGITTEDLTDWDSSSNVTESLETGEGHREGSNVVKGVVGNPNLCDIDFHDTSLTIDAENPSKCLVFDFKIKKDTYDDEIHFWWGSGPSDRYKFIFDAADFIENTWYTIILSHDDSDGSNGSPDESDMDYFGCEWNQNTVGVTGTSVYFDNFKLLNPIATIQNNAAGGAPFDGLDADERMRIALRWGGDWLLKTAQNFIINTSLDDVGGSGTTRPTDRLSPAYYRIGMAALDAWEEFQNTSYASFGTPRPDDTAIELIHIQINYGAFLGCDFTGQYPRDPTFTLHVDILSVPNEFETAWGTGTGAVMHDPPDALRYWIEIVGGEEIDATSYIALLAAHASGQWGFDFRSLGFSWEEILQRMAFEARCNVFPVETAAGRVWKMSGADIDYGFGSAASDAVISQTHDMIDDGRNVDDLASYFSFRYAFDASLGSGSEEGFKLALDAHPTLTDVPISTANILAASKRFGAIASGPIAFRCIQNPATAQNAAGYYVQERMANDRRVFRLSGVAWFDALPHDIGDIVSITAPWSSSATNCRIISMSKAFAENTWTIIAVEVPSTGLHT